MPTRVVSNVGSFNCPENRSKVIPHERCSWSEEQRYCVLVGWDDFKSDPNKHIERAFDKHSAEISNKVIEQSVEGWDVVLFLYIPAVLRSGI